MSRSHEHMRSSQDIDQLLNDAEITTLEAKLEEAIGLLTHLIAECAMPKVLQRRVAEFIYESQVADEPR